MSRHEHELDDRVHRFQGRWYGEQGEPLPFAFRYVAYGYFAACFLVLAALGWPLTVMTGIISAPQMVASCVIASLTVTVVILANAENDLTPRAVVTLTAWHAVARRAVARQARNARRETRPYVYRRVRVRSGA